MSRGRGSNPASRKNLTGPKRNWCVMNKGTDGLWHKIEGGMTARFAQAGAARLEALNATDKKPLYVATIEDGK